MINKKLLIGFLFFFSISFSIAQPTHTYTDKETKFKEAADYFTEGQFLLA